MVLFPFTERSSSENLTRSWRVQTPVIDYSKCIRCMICWKFCPDDSFFLDSTGKLESPNERIAKMEAPTIDYDHCKGCGICSYECPEKCVTMTEEGGGPA